MPHVAIDWAWMFGVAGCWLALFLGFVFLVWIAGALTPRRPAERRPLAPLVELDLRRAARLRRRTTRSRETT